MACLLPPAPGRHIPHRSRLIIQSAHGGKRAQKMAPARSRAGAISLLCYVT